MVSWTSWTIPGRRWGPRRRSRCVRRSLGAAAPVIAIVSRPRAPAAAGTPRPGRRPPWQRPSAMSSGRGDAPASRRRWDRCWERSRAGALADDHRVHELDGGVGGVGRGGAGAERDQRPAAREGARHRVAGAREALRSASRNSRRTRSRSATPASRSSVAVGARSFDRAAPAARRAPPRTGRRAARGTLASAAPPPRRSSTSRSRRGSGPSRRRDGVGPSASRPTLTLRRTPETSALAMWCSGSTISTIWPGMPRHMVRSSLPHARPVRS